MDSVWQWLNRQRRAEMVLLPIIFIVLIQLSPSATDNAEEDAILGKNRMLRIQSNIFQYLVSSAEEPRSSYSVVDADKLDSDFRIVGGTAAPAGKYPFYVNTLRPILCGGTLIHPDIVLSAAHCEGGFLAGVSIGGLRIDGSDGDFLGVEDELLHPDYDEATRFNDIMLVKLSSPTSVSPIALNFNSNVPSVDQQVTVAGYGDTSDGGDTSAILLEVTVDTFSDTFCDTLYRDYEPSIMICAGTEDGGRDSCQGDSGGPLFTNDISVQIGVVSTGSGCGEPNIPAIYTEVAAYEAWIRQGICQLSSVPPASCNTVPPSMEPIVITPSPVQSPVADPTTSSPVVSPTGAPVRTPTGAPVRTPTGAPVKAPVTAAPITSAPRPSPTAAPTATPPSSSAPTKSPAPTGTPTISPAPSISQEPTVIASDNDDFNRGTDDDDDDDGSKKKERKSDDDDDDSSDKGSESMKKSKSMKGEKSKGMKGGMMKQKGMKSGSSNMKRNESANLKVPNIVYTRRHPWTKLGIGI